MYACSSSSVAMMRAMIYDLPMIVAMISYTYSYGDM